MREGHFCSLFVTTSPKPLNEERGIILHQPPAGYRPRSLAAYLTTDGRGDRAPTPASSSRPSAVLQAQFCICFCRGGVSPPGFAFGFTWHKEGRGDRAPTSDAREGSGVFQIRNDQASQHRESNAGCASLAAQLLRTRHSRWRFAGSDSPVHRGQSGPLGVRSRKSVRSLSGRGERVGAHLTRGQVSGVRGTLHVLIWGNKNGGRGDRAPESGRSRNPQNSRGKA